MWFAAVTCQVLSWIRLLALQDCGASLRDLMTFTGSHRPELFMKNSRSLLSCGESN